MKKILNEWRKFLKEDLWSQTAPHKGFRTTPIGTGGSEPFQTSRWKVSGPSSGYLRSGGFGKTKQSPTKISGKISSSLLGVAGDVAFDSKFSEDKFKIAYHIFKDLAEKIGINLTELGSTYLRYRFVERDGGNREGGDPELKALKKELDRQVKPASIKKELFNTEEGLDLVNWWRQNIHDLTGAGVLFAGEAGHGMAMVLYHFFAAIYQHVQQHGIDIEDSQKFEAGVLYFITRAAGIIEDEPDLEPKKDQPSPPAGRVSVPQGMLK